MTHPTFPITGPGSQPTDEDGASLDFMEMPDGMMTYSMPNILEPDEVDGVDAAMAVLRDLQAGLEAGLQGDGPREFEITGLDAANRAFIDTILGEGDVSIIAGDRVQIQESVLTGVWRVFYTDGEKARLRDVIEIGAFPAAALELAREGTASAVVPDLGAMGDGVVNAPALLTELAEQVSGRAPGTPAHVINLTLLPNTDDDLAYLDRSLGAGRVVVLSRGYGNCRVTSTATRDVWWVQYYNSQDALILDTIEVSDVPNVACAAPEDIADSAGRLLEILEVYR